MNEMGGTILTLNGLSQWWGHACLTSYWWVWFGRRCLPYIKIAQIYRGGMDKRSLSVLNLRDDVSKSFIGKFEWTMQAV